MQAILNIYSQDPSDCQTYEILPQRCVETVGRTKEAEVSSPISLCRTPRSLHADLSTFFFLSSYRLPREEHLLSDTVLQL